MRLLLLAILCFYALKTDAQVQFGSIQEIFTYANQHATTVQIAISDQKIAASRYNAAKTAMLPSVSASAGYNDNITLQPTLVPANLFDPRAPEGTYNEFTFGRKYVYNAGIQASWDVLNFQKSFDIRTAGAALKISEANISVSKQQVYEQIAQLYFSILLTEKYRTFNEANLDAADSIQRIANEKFHAGLFSEENANRSTLQLSQARQQLGNTKYALLQLYNQLAALLNVNGPITLTDTIPDFTGIKHLDTDISHPHPQILVEEARLELDKAQLSQANAARYPVLTLGYQLNQSWATDDMLNLKNANNLPQQFWGARLTLPVFNGFATSQRIKQARIQRDQQAIVLDNRKLAVQKEDDNLKIQYLHSIDDLKSQHEILQLQQVNDQHAIDRYKTGIAGLDERLQRFQELLLIQEQYMDKLSNYYIYYYKIHIRSLLYTADWDVNEHNTRR
jgi:outer membrane protein TolC